MNNNYNSLAGTSLENPVLDKGKKMWQSLDVLAAYYENSDMSKISAISKFSDNKWDVIGSNRYNFLWNVWLPNSECYPLLIVCKVVAYYGLNTQNNKISSTQPRIQSFISSFKELLTSKGILIANRDQPFQILSYLDLTDILHLVQMEFVRKRTISENALYGFNQIVTCPLVSFPNAEFLISASSHSLPWSGESLRLWGNSVKTAFLKQEGKTSDTIAEMIKRKPYSPLKLGVMELLIQVSMPFVEEHFELIKNVFDIIEAEKEKSTIKHSIAKLTRSKIARMYGKKLDKILPLKYTEITDENSKGTLSVKWFSDFEQLIQGAVAWLILLTTGLRNCDMRNLVIGCCQPSKRFDLLNYLITDIKKTNLSNYIIPVPSVIAKAIELVTIAKKFRTGDMLFTQRHATGKDNSTNDPRKITCGQGFNNLIHAFAAHYDIKLDTIADDGYDATPHCIRATLAGYIGENSQAAIIILKRLFGHSNNLMPDAYLVNNPIIIKQRRKNINDAQEELATIMTKNVVSKKVSGTKGKQMLAGLKHIESELRAELKNESLTEMDFHVRLEDRLKEILLMRIQGEDIYALKTPVGVICMRSQSDSTDSPCALVGNHKERIKLNISKDVTDVLATLPNPAHCVGKNCSDALLGKDWSRDLLTSFDFYIKLLKGQGHKNIDIRNQANHFIKGYGPLLKDIYSDEREDSYFD